MTKEDYEALAKALSRALRACETVNQRRGVERAALTIAEACAIDNPRFDSTRFLLAVRA